MSNAILIERKNVGVVELQINRPEALNALNPAVLIEMKQELEKLSQDPTVRVVVLRGLGDKAFIAGADIKQMVDMNRDDATQLSRLGHSVCLLLEQMPKVTIAAVHGFALGGGTEIALACDFIMASERAVFGLPEVCLGVIPGFGGTIRLSRAVGVNSAKELMFSGDKIKAPEAMTLGLIRHAYPQDTFFEEVNQMAEKVARNSASAIRVAKKLLNEFEEEVGTHFKVDAEIHGFARLFDDPDQKEGMSAFVEKRAPQFTGLK